MSRVKVKTMLAVSVVMLFLLMASPAEAFRCKNKIVTDGMHEQEVIGICGEPATRRNIGVAARSYDYYFRSVSPGTGRRHWLPGNRYLTEEVVVTEFVYNFGPRKLMRRLVFEGGVLVSIETLGYGYRPKTPD